MRESIRLILLLVVIAAIAGVGGWFAFLRNTAPDEEAGRAWLAGFADLVTSSRLLGARGPAALSLIPSLVPGRRPGARRIGASRMAWGQSSSPNISNWPGRNPILAIRRSSASLARYGIYIRLEEPVGPSEGGAFSVAVTRFLGAPNAVPEAEDGEHWLHWIVSLLTGPELVDSHGMQTVRLVDAAITPDPTLGGGCSTSFSTSGASVKQSSMTKPCS